MSLKTQLIKKLIEAEFSAFPFRHLYIENFFPDDVFDRAVSSKAVNIAASSDSELLSLLFDRGYKIIDFPGSTIDHEKYIEWRNNAKLEKSGVPDVCEGFGVTLRLFDTRDQLLEEIKEVFTSDEFRNCLVEKFALDDEVLSFDFGLQKYLDGYEISPHPDIRKKALTFMMNLNPNPNAHRAIHHCHLMQFKKEYRYVQAYWEGNPSADRCWVPWSWCESAFLHNANNSILIFSPSDSTLHGVRSSYDHLRYQRTQLYGNFWKTERTTVTNPDWQSYVVKGSEFSTLVKTEKERGSLHNTNVESSHLSQM